MRLPLPPPFAGDAADGRKQGAAVAAGRRVNTAGCSAARKRTITASDSPHSQHSLQPLQLPAWLQDLLQQQERLLARIQGDPLGSYSMSAAPSSSPSPSSSSPSDAGPPATTAGSLATATHQHLPFAKMLRPPRFSNPFAALPIPGGSSSAVSAASPASASASPPSASQGEAAPPSAAAPEPAPSAAGSKALILLPRQRLLLVPAADSTPATTADVITVVEAGSLKDPRVEPIPGPDSGSGPSAVIPGPSVVTWSKLAGWRVELPPNLPDLTKLRPDIEKLRPALEARVQHTLSHYSPHSLCLSFPPPLFPHPPSSPSPPLHPPFSSSSPLPPHSMVWYDAATMVPMAPPAATSAPAGSVIKSALAGGLASGLSTCLMHPLDTIKTRVQASSASLSEVVRSVPSIGIQGLYRGAPPAILGQFASHGLRTGAYEASKMLLTSMLPNLTEYQYWERAEAAAAGRAVQQQHAQALNHLSSLPLHPASSHTRRSNQRHHSAPRCWERPSAARPVQQHSQAPNHLLSFLSPPSPRPSLRSLPPDPTSGLSLLHCVGNGSPHSLSLAMCCAGSSPPGRLPARRLLGFDCCLRMSLASILSPLQVTRHVLRRELAPWETLLLGGFSGGMAAIAITPFDVIKTRMMTSPPGVAAAGMLTVGANLLATEGVGALYKGWLPRFFWIAPLGAMNFAGYELAKQAIDDVGEEGTEA
ncbi:unnamed protein product [Closterium sp. NIES-53]